jgi:bifunctional non-homologous end joining protein LigD
MQFRESLFFRAFHGVSQIAASKRRGAPRDPFAWLGKHLRATSMPTSPKPMLCTLVDEAFDEPSWIFEPKYDGLRVLGRFDGRRVSLLSRNEKSQNSLFPDVVGSLEECLKRPAIVDGEIVCLDEKG